MFLDLQLQTPRALGSSIWNGTTKSCEAGGPVSDAQSSAAATAGFTAAASRLPGGPLAALHATAATAAHSSGHPSLHADAASGAGPPAAAATACTTPPAYSNLHSRPEINPLRDDLRGVGISKRRRWPQKLSNASALSSVSCSVEELQAPGRSVLYSQLLRMLVLAVL